jgi:hypothetical protein
LQASLSAATAANGSAAHKAEMAAFLAFDMMSPLVLRLRGHCQEWFADSLAIS